MDNNKGYLVQLIKQIVHPYFANVIADILIAHGVTIPQWISVEDRLPENEDVVLCVTKNKRPFVCRYDHYWKHWRVSGSVKVTHWMPLPEPPKEDET